MDLESRILDGKPCGYCSSSEGEEEDFKVVKDEDDHQANVMRQFGPSANTGAKGVLEDFKQFRERTRQAVEERNMKFLQQAKRGMMVGTKEERERAQRDEDDEDEAMLDQIRARRLQEMRKAAATRMVEIISKEQYLEAVDRSSDYLLCVLIYEPNDENCNKLTYMCKILASDFPKTKFIRATSTLLGMSQAFKTSGVPTLQFYHHGNLIGNFLKVSHQLGHDYDVNKLKEFLRKQHIDMRMGRYATDSEAESDDECD